MTKFSLNELQAALLKNGIIDLQGDVGEKMFQYARDCLNCLAVNGNPAVRVQISSGGGGVTTGLMIYDMLRLYPGEKTGVVVGFARSMATVILQACDSRLCTQNSFLFLHYVRCREMIGLEDMEDKKKLKKIVDSARKDQERIFRILEEKTGKPRQRIIAWCKKGNNDEEISAKEALRYGLIDGII